MGPGTEVTRRAFELEATALPKVIGDGPLPMKQAIALIGQTPTEKKCLGDLLRDDKINRAAQVI